MNTNVIKETWKDIDGYESLYQVSDLGRVRSLDKIVKGRNNHYLRKGKILKGRDNKHGYLCVALYKNGQRKDFRIHRLVAKHFISNELNKEVNHIDRDKKNNIVSNLEWVTSKENAQHFIKTGVTRRYYENARATGLKYGGNKKAMETLKKKLSIKVKQIDPETKEIIKVWDSAMDAQRALKIPNQNIIRSTKRKIKAGGFYWQQ